MFRHVPNLLTGLRLVLAAVFFGMLAYYQYEGRGDPWFLNTAFVIYLVALFTDFLDGYLARKWKVEGAFGRVVDPFVDKVLVLGSFIFFAGKNFVIQDAIVNEGQTVHVVKTISGVAPWMVVVLLARELLVTSLRGMAESQGQKFGADMGGKLKMVFQSATILVVLTYVNYYGWLDRPEHGLAKGIATWFRDICIWGTVLITLASGWSYIRRGVALYQTKNVEVPAA